jgi:hypothetical protein
MKIAMGVRLQQSVSGERVARVCVCVCVSVSVQDMHMHQRTHARITVWIGNKRQYIPCVTDCYATPQHKHEHTCIFSVFPCHPYFHAQVGPTAKSSRRLKNILSVHTSVCPATNVILSVHTSVCPATNVILSVHTSVCPATSVCIRRMMQTYLQSAPHRKRNAAFDHLKFIQLRHIHTNQRVHARFLEDCE